MRNPLLLQALLLASLGSSAQTAEVEHPDWSWPRSMRWGRACPACRREVAQGVKACDRGHKPTKTRRVQLPK